MKQALAQNLTILAVDDEPNNLDLIERVLVRDGHRCVRATTGEGALESAVSDPPDLVLMDIMLPGIDGFETTRRLRRLLGERWVPVIFLSALDKSIDIVTGLDAGGDDYMTKPIDLGVLKAKIEASQRVITRHRQIENRSRQLRDYYDENEAEKQLAAGIMLHLRRDGRPPIPGVEFMTVAAIDVAGDIVASEETPDGRLHVMLADATGHGLVAAINLLPVVEAFYGMTADGHCIENIIHHINTLLLELIPGHRFVSALFAELDASHETIEIWNAGVPRALLVDASGKLRQAFASKIVPLGICRLDADQLLGEMAVMHQGDALIAFSDGLIEAENSSGEAFSEAGLLAALPDALSGGGCENILQCLRDHSSGPSFADDVSLCIARQGTPPRVFRSPMPGNPPSASDDDAGFSMSFDPEQIRRLTNIVPRFMDMARSHFNLAPTEYRRIFRVVRQLTGNAIDWGLLRLPPSTAEQSPDFRKQLRAAALSSLNTGWLRMRIHARRLGDGRNAWEVDIEDSGPGFDSAAAIELSTAGTSKPKGLALVANEVLALQFSPPGNRVRAWISD